MSLAEALTECLWLKPFLFSIGVVIEKPVAINVDNQAAIHLSRNPEFHRRTKHVGVRFHRVRQEQENGVVEIAYVPTDKNVSDILTKSATSFSLERNLKLMNIA